MRQSKTNGLKRIVTYGNDLTEIDTRKGEDKTPPFFMVDNIHNAIQHPWPLE